jgi:hypothetical protein
MKADAMKCPRQSVGSSIAKLDLRKNSGSIDSTIGGMQ